MTKITTISTSQSSAKVSDVVLREGPLTRLVFSPMIVNNPNDKSAAVNGTFVYQKKLKNNNWEDVSSVSLSKIKPGEAYKLKLKSAEILRLYNELEKLYKLHQAKGVVQGHKTFIQASPQLQALASACP